MFYKKQKGFTIIELMIAIFVLSVAVLGIYSAFSVIVVLTENTSDRLMAAYLAQEGIEIIRNIRDNNWLIAEQLGGDPSAEWTNGLLNDCSPESGGCKLDYTTPKTTPLQHYVSQDDYLYLYEGFYSYLNRDPPAIKTKFMRKITVSPVGGYDYIIKVDVYVYWDIKPNILNLSGGKAGDGTPNSGYFTAQEYLYNWYNYVLPEAAQPIE